jgi:poly-beta-1,6-N-acetyl-D-glucosamine synthase
MRNIGHGQPRRKKTGGNSKDYKGDKFYSGSKITTKLTKRNYFAVNILFLTYVQLMLPATESVFWICFFILFYTYVGYPLLLRLLILIKNIISPPQISNDIYLPVTLIVAAYNEEDVIEEKIKNCMSLNYPAGLIKFIFITDGSDDNTPSIIKRYTDIIHLHQDERRGKLAAMNRAMKAVETGIVIFSDANTMLNRDSIGKMVAHYADDKVGAVAGEKKVISSDDGAIAKGEGLYWKYESWIKRLDSQFYTVVGAAGELFSLRRNLYTTLPENIIIEDFVQSLLICARGFVVRYEPEAYSIEKASVSIKDEMERKTRIAAGGFQAIICLKKLFNIFRYPILSFQYISHRVLRWTLCPLALVVMFATSLGLALDGSLFFIYLVIFQVVFYFSALAGWLLAGKDRHPGVFYLPYYFIFMHLCVFAGFGRFVAGHQAVEWKKAQRK